jgi:glyoxylase-like metal-dependent hydrolase (beta-lactamase superfamily II)
VRAQPAPEDLGDGLYSVPVPIPGSPLGYTLVYALESARGPVLVDAGWEHVESWNALSRGLAALGLEVRDVYGVVVTHHHPDHSGLAGRVRAASGAWIAMHAADAAIVRRFHRLSRDSGREWEFTALRRAGASEAEINEARASPARIDPPAIPDRELEDGDLADLPGRKLRVIWTPGHSPGHICLHLEGADRLFTGDHVLPKITPNVGLYAFDEPDANPLGDFLRSLARVGEIGAKEALPAHEYRFTDLSDRTDAIAAHHEERLAEVVAILADGSPRQGDAPGGGSRSVTVWEVTSRMRWNAPFAAMHPMHRRLAAGEAAAHLRLLEHRGLARLVPGPGPQRYTTRSSPGPGSP